MNNPRNLHNVYLGLGTNLGDKSANIHTALEQIDHKIGKLVKVSACYETAPVGFESENSFLNAACIVATQLSPSKVLKTTQIIEKEMGRTLKSVNGIHTDRIIDIDILLSDQSIVNEEGLIIPHPQLHKRDFVLLPMSQIAPDLPHPIFQDTMMELLNKIRK